MQTVNGDSMRTRLAEIRCLSGNGFVEADAQSRRADRLPRLFVASGVALLIALGALFGLFTSSAQAQAGCTGVACVTSGSTVLELDSTQSPVLNAILSNLTGSSINLSAADYNALADANVELGELLTQLQADVGVGTPEELLTTDITLGELLMAAATIAGDNDIELVLNNLALALDLDLTIQLGDLLQITLPADAFSEIDLNLFDLVVGSIQLFNYENMVGAPDGITIDGDVLGIGGIGDVTLRATVAEAPVIVCGPAGSTFNSAAMRIALDVSLLDVKSSDSITIGALGVNVEATVTDLTLYLDIGRGQGIIQTVDAVTGAVSIEATPGVVNLYLGSINSDIFFDRGATITAADVEFGTIGAVTLSAIGLTPSVVDIRARSVAEGGNPSAEILNFTGPYPETQTTATGPGALNNLLVSLLANLEVEIELVGDFALLAGLLDFVVDLVNDLVSDTLSPILNALLTSIIDPVLDALGLTVGQMTVTVLGADALCPSLTVTKTHDADFQAGDTGAYNISVRNDGSGPTTGPITVTDTLPTELSYSSFSGTGWSFDGQSGQDVRFVHEGPLAAGDTLPILTLFVDVDILATGVITNQVTVTTPGNEDTGNSADDDPTTIIDAAPADICAQAGICPSLTVEKTHTGDFTAGAQGVYSITVRNDGANSTFDTIVVTDTLPTGMTFGQASGDGWALWEEQSSGQVVVFTHPGPIGPGQSLPLLILQVNVSAEAAGTLVNGVVVDTPGNIANGSSEDQDPTEVVPPTSEDFPSLTVTKSHQGNFVAGGQGVYTIQVVNHGAGATTGAITVIDTLPAGFSYAGHTGTGWQLSSDSGQTVIFTHAGPLAPGNALPALQITVNISAEVTGTVVNSVTVDTPGNIANGSSEDQDPTEVVPPGDPETLCLEQGVCPALQLQKIAVGDFVAGGTGQYRFSVENTGGGATYGTIVLTDTLPAGLAYLSHTGDGWSVSSQDGQTLVLQHPGPVMPGGTLPTLIINVSIDAALEGQIVNSATVGTPGGIGGGEIDDAPTDVLPGTDCPQEGACPSLTVEKSHTGDFQAGSNGVYTILVHNNGSGPTLGSIIVEDTLPAGMSYVSHSGSGWGLLQEDGQTLLFTHPGPVAAGESLPALQLIVRVSPEASGTLVNQVTVDTPGNVPSEGQSGEDPTQIVPLRLFYIPIIERGAGP